MKVSRISKFPPNIVREIDRRLIAMGFSGYEELADELNRRHYRISKSALHRYGAELERRVTLARAEDQLVQAGIGRELVAEMTGESTLVVLIDRRNGAARMKTVPAPVAAVLRHLKTLATTHPAPAPSAAGALPAAERPERPAGSFIPEGQP